MQVSSPGSSASRHARWSYLLPHALYFLPMLLFFVIDILLPRGATSAIGYCLVPVLARRLADRKFIIVMTGICTVLTWIGYLVEPAGAAAWISFFDRMMVTGVLWLTLLLVSRQLDAEIALREKTDDLENAVTELHRSNAELESFASIVSHDIRGPLNSIAFAINVLSAQSAVKSDPECNDWLNSINSEIARTSDLIETLLAYARIGAGKVHLVDCDCESILADVRKTLRAELDNAKAEVTNDPLPIIPADPALMAELFQNLIENGIKYQQAAPPQIHISATPAEGGWSFSVRDNGIGIAAEECARLFEPFYRGTTPANAAGFGLGLATCKRIVDRHGGRIEVDSRLGQGSTFRFFIPAAEG